MTEYRKYWDEETETMPREKIREFQLSKMKEMIELTYTKSPYYKKLFDEAGVGPSDLKHLDDLKKFPSIDKKDLRSRQQAAPDFGDLICAPEEDFVYLSASSGSTGVPTASPFTAQDFEDFQDFQARLFWSSGMRPNDRYCHALNFTLFVGGPDVIGAMKVGALTIWGGAIPSDRLLSILKTWRATITWTTPSYAWFLGETAKENGIDPAKEFAIKKIFVAGEPGGSIPETKKNIEALWGADVYDYYGLSDIFGACAGMCEAKDGLHWAEDHIYIEVVDPDTGEEVPEGERGELILTSIKKVARPLIRFRTGDIVSYTTEPCSCGRTHLRLHGIHGRLDDMMIIKGVNVFPSDIETIVRDNENLTGEYVCVITEEKHMAVLTVEVEKTDGFQGDTDALASEIQTECQKIVGIRPKIKLLEAKSLTRATHKAKRVRDERKKA
ncbi:phenylacetate--CoA ligase [Desulfococcaceae bacterium HSG8]|nr:phenylacetate--CoA ligase [Desulfococcaceae bacterium HSG8]